MSERAQPTLSCTHFPSALVATARRKRHQFWPGQIDNWPHYSRSVGNKPVFASSAEAARPRFTWARPSVFSRAWTSLLPRRRGAFTVAFAGKSNDNSALRIGRHASTGLALLLLVLPLAEPSLVSLTRSSNPESAVRQETQHPQRTAPPVGIKAKATSAHPLSRAESIGCATLSGSLHAQAVQVS